MDHKTWRTALRGAAIAGLLGAVVALVEPMVANAATVCCYRYWGVSSSAASAGQFKQSPTVTRIDWNATWVEHKDGFLTAHSRVYWQGGSSLASGGGGSWVYANPGGEVPYAYGRCGFYWDIPNPGHPQDMYCDIKYSN
ncbi:hypothetical protein [Agromyces sp. NPDC060279]|uniref:hypothetical protein n=1 Tax=Agromyces sp. NPDC060279 TaxID=3347092 RepID=UPI0036531006